MGSAPDAGTDTTGASTFRFLHAADLHLDSPMRGLVRYEDAPADVLRSATRRAFDRLVEHAIARKVAFVVIAGDLYDGEWREVGTGHYFLRQVRALGAAGIEVFVLHGNHDFQSPIVRHLRGQLPDNLRVFPADAPASFEARSATATLHGQSYPRREVLVDMARHYPAPVPGRLNIGVLHTAAEGPSDHRPYAPCTVQELVARGYDYWALGHVHEARRLAAEPPIVFPGNLQGRNARETGPKGCVEVACAGGRVVDVRPVVLDVLRWHRLSVDVSAAEDEGAVLAAFESALRSTLDTSDATAHAVRTTLVGDTALHPQLRADREDLRERMQSVAAGVGEVWLEKLVVETRPVGQPPVGGPLWEALSRLVQDPALKGSQVVQDAVDELDGRFRPLIKSFEEEGDGALLTQDELAELANEGAALVVERLGRSGGAA